ncbi:MAG: hypothetical protein AAF297_06700, partial [Planctomycetota bacterium]
VAMESFERPLVESVVEGARPDDPWLRARATEAIEMAVRNTMVTHGSPDHELQARWWLRLKDEGWSHPLVTVLSMDALTREVPFGWTVDGVLDEVEASIEELVGDEAFAALPAYRRALSAWSFADELKRLEQPEEVVDVWRSRGEAFLVESLQADRPAAERTAALFKAEFRVTGRHTVDEVWRLLDLLEASESPDPYAACYIRGALMFREAWQARGSGFGHTVTDEGWRVFELKMKAADRLLRKAYSIDEKFYLAPSRMVRVAMSGHAGAGNDPLLWHNIVTAWTPTATRSWDSLMWASRPRWGGGLREMAEVMMLGAEHARRTPQIAPVTLSMIEDLGDEVDDDRLGWRLPGLWNTVRPLYEDALSGVGAEGRPMTPHERWLTLNKLIIAAWCNGDYESAQRYYLMNGKSLDSSSTEEFKLDWWRMRDVLRLLATPARDPLLEAVRLEDAGRFVEAAQAYGRASAVGVARRGMFGYDESLVKLHHRALLRVEYERRGWVDLLYGSKKSGGVWVDEMPNLMNQGGFLYADGGLQARRMHRQTARNVYQFPLGTWYEVEAVLKPLDARGNRPMGGVGLGVMCRYPHSYGNHWTLELTGDGSRAVFGWAARGDYGGVEIDPEQSTAGPITLRFRLEGRRMRAWVDDELIADRMAEDQWELGEYLAVVARQNDGGPDGAKFTTLRVRRIVEPNGQAVPGF